jgi:hypothetical protein
MGIIFNSDLYAYPVPHKSLTGRKKNFGITSLSVALYRIKYEFAHAGIQPPGAGRHPGAALDL